MGRLLRCNYWVFSLVFFIGFFLHRFLCRNYLSIKMKMKKFIMIRLILILLLRMLGKILLLNMFRNKNIIKNIIIPQILILRIKLKELNKCNKWLACKLKLIKYILLLYINKLKLCFQIKIYENMFVCVCVFFFFFMYLFLFYFIFLFLFYLLIFFFFFINYL
jgi:hypothetical protein